MPAVSRNQFVAMEIAKHNPSKLKPANKGLAKMSKSQLDEFTQPGMEKGLPQHKEKKK